MDGLSGPARPGGLHWAGLEYGKIEGATHETLYESQSVQRNFMNHLNDFTGNSFFESYLIHVSVMLTRN